MNCKNGCPPNIDMRTCKKALNGNCQFIITKGGTGLFFVNNRQLSLDEKLNS